MSNRVKVPSVIYYEPYNAEFNIEESIIMEFIPGIEGRKLTNDDLLNQKQIPIFRNNLLSVLKLLSQATHPEGFGSLKGPFYKQWWDYYGQKVAGIHRGIEIQLEKDQCTLSEKVIAVAERSIGLGSKVFATHRPQPTLIHGDFCPGNILVNPQSLEVIGVIDPIHSEWGDHELDSIHLIKSNGHLYKLYEGFREDYCQTHTLSVDDDGLRLRYWYYNFWAWLSYYVLIDLDDGPWYNHCAKTLNTELNRHFD